MAGPWRKGLAPFPFSPLTHGALWCPRSVFAGLGGEIPYPKREYIKKDPAAVAKPPGHETAAGAGAAVAAVAPAAASLGAAAPYPPAMMHGVSRAPPPLSLPAARPTAAATASGPPVYGLPPPPAAAVGYPAYGCVLRSVAETYTSADGAPWQP